MTAPTTIDGAAMEEQWKFNEWVCELAEPFWLKDAQKDGEFFDANGFARALLSASKPAVTMGCVLVEEADFVPHVHPQYGSGVFCTEDCLNKLAAAPAVPAQSPSLIGWWDSAEASGFRWKEGIVRSDFSNGTPIYANAAPPAQSGEPHGYAPVNQNGNYFTKNKATADYVGGMMPVYAAPPAQTANVAPAATVQSGEAGSAYCPSQFGKQPHAFNHQKCGYCGIAAPQPSQPVEAGETKRFPTPISISTDKICEIASKYNLGNPRLDALRCFVNEIIIVNEAEYAKSE